MTTEMEITATSPRRFDETVETVERLVAENGFRVLHIHDVQATLKEKGLEINPFKIVEICNAKYAYKVLNADPRIGMMLPCKINVYADGKKSVVVTGMRPTVIGRFFPGVDLGTVPEDVERVINTIIEGVKGQ